MKTSHGFSSSKRSNKFRIPLLLSLLVFLVLSPLSSGYPAKPGSSDIYSGNEKAYIEVDARATMGVTISLIETYLQQALTSLRLIAASPATRSGIWPEIKPGLETLRNAIPGAALYIEPDGDYFSVEKGYTGLNVADRSYFGPLFAGKEIHGSLIYSRSTGKQSVLMAVPVIENEEVTGAVAISIFLEDLQRLIANSLRLPEGYIWYVLDENANTVLHPREDFVFMYPAEQGSPSLRSAVETIIAKEQGETSYIFAGRNTHILFRKLSFNDWRLVFGKTGEKVDDQYMPEAYEILHNISEKIKENLVEMDQYLESAISGFGNDIPPEHVAKNTFRRLYDDNPYVISSALIDTEGSIIYIEPHEFHNLSGRNISDHEGFMQMQRKNAPILTNSFLADEGFDAVCLQHPLFGDDGEFIGSVSLLLRPEIMVEEVVTPYIAETNYEPWIMEPGGRIIFDKAFGGTGKLLFLDFLFEDQKTLLKLGDAIAENKSGQRDYVYYYPGTNERSLRMAIWDTINIHGTEWRVVLSYPPYEI